MLHHNLINKIQLEILDPYGWNTVSLIENFSLLCYFTVSLTCCFSIVTSIVASVFNKYYATDLYFQTLLEQFGIS